MDLFVLSLRRAAAVLSFQFVAAVVAALLASSVALAEGKPPSAKDQEVLIKTSLLSLNDANLTGNYAVLHAKLSKPFREQFTPDHLKQSFKEFADKKIDWEAVVAMSPIPTKESHVDGRGALVLRGYFDAGSKHVVYALDFIPSEGEWKPIKLNVHVKSANEK